MLFFLSKINLTSLKRSMTIFSVILNRRLIHILFLLVPYITIQFNVSTQLNRCPFEAQKKYTIVFNTNSLKFIASKKKTNLYKFH